MDNNRTYSLDSLRQDTLNLGASDAEIISTKMISVEDDLIEMCKDPFCNGYGKTINCPPHTISPNDFRKELENYQKGLLFKIDVSPHILLSEERFEAFRKIYEIAAQIENTAIRRGFPHSKAFAAGSCKPVFCKEYECMALIEGGECRYPEIARPSMEAVGMNVFKLIRDMGWEIHTMTAESDPESIPNSLLAGLVLIE